MDSKKYIGMDVHKESISIAVMNSAKQILLDRMGCEARKIPAAGDVFFLDFAFYRTYRDLAQVECC